MWEIVPFRNKGRVEIVEGILVAEHDDGKRQGLVLAPGDRHRRLLAQELVHLAPAEPRETGHASTEGQNPAEHEEHGVQVFKSSRHLKRSKTWLCLRLSLKEPLGTAQLDPTLSWINHR